MKKIEMKYNKKNWPLKEIFRTSSRTENLNVAETIEVSIKINDIIGRGESTPYIRYGETINNSLSQLKKIKTLVEAGLTREDLQNAMHPSSARCAVDCALWDIEAKLNKKRVWDLLNISNKPREIISAESFGIRSLKKLKNGITKCNNPPLIKLKADRNNVYNIVETAFNASPTSKFIVDFNESLFPSDIQLVSKKLKKFNVVLLEQPLHANQDEILKNFKHTIPIGADESCHTSEDIDHIKQKYDCVIIKPGKCGGLTEAFKLKKLAEKNNLKTMIVCMFGSSLAVAPAYTLALDGADFVNIEVPKIMAKDRKYKIRCLNQTVSIPDARLWG